MKIKIGFIGAGYIAGVHAAVLARDERVQIAAIHDVVPERANLLAHAAGANAVHGVGEVLDSCDAIYITTPNTKHTEAAIQAIEARKHVFCEKPMATNLADARQIVHASEQSESIFQVGHNRRFAPVYVELKQLIAQSSGPHSAHAKMNRGELLNPSWVGDPTVTGGFLYETTIHMFDMLRFLFGEVKTLRAIGSTHEYAEVDDFSILFEFASGMHATLASSADAGWLFPFERIEVFTHHGTIVTREMETLVHSDALDGRHIEHSMHQLSKEEKWGYAQEDRAFIDSIVEGKPAAVTAVDGLKSIELANAVYESVRSGGAITLA